MILLLRNVRKQSFPSILDLLAIFDPEKLTQCDAPGHNFAIPGGIAPKILNTYLGYWWHLLSNFMPIGEILAEKTMTEQKKKKKNKKPNELSIRPRLRILRMEG